MRTLVLLTSVWFVAVATICSAVVAGEQVAAEAVDFARQILPLLSDKCFVCHGPDGEQKKVLRLDSFAGATRDLGGRRAIDPDHLDRSEVLVRIQSNTDPMPPEDFEKRLTTRERELLRRWIQQGGEYAKHWAFVPPQKATHSDDVAGPDGNRIDTYVLARLRQEDITFSQAARRATLARRAALVLTGLPPDTRQLSAFLTDHRADAYERFVEVLLDSPRYGEHQARYWLDAVRYGDTHGLHLDNRRAIYAYRDWVVRSFNRNQPLDEFITWQLAGDLLPNPTLEQHVATGFVRMNPTTAEGGAIPEEFQAKNNFDRVETLGTVFLGMTLTCARCHTHKYDPISQTEYYQLLAFFNSTAEPSMDGNKYEFGPVVKAPASVAAWEEWTELESACDSLLSQAARRLKEPDRVDWNDSGKRSQASKQDRLAMVADPMGPFDSAVRQQAAALAKRMAEAKKAFTSTLVAQDLAEPRPTRLLTRGQYNLPTGDPLEPDVLTVMGTFSAGTPRNRLGLAQWLTAREHPLVARVLINRVWQRTFGHALVRTPEDFGLQGQQPTHAKLLDWLAVELQESGWDLKHMLRLMVTSRTFRQSSAWRDGIDDPENRLLARGPGHRLDAEVIRDVGLWASGLLDPFMGGEGVKPYQPEGLWAALMHPSSNTKLYVQDKGQKPYRRSLYVYWKRTSPHPMMTLFDAPSRESSCVRRSRTNTSLQSLGLLNETQRTEMARALATRLLREGTDDTQRLNMLFNLLGSRDPTDGERAVCTRLLHSAQARYAAAVDEARALLAIGNAPRDRQLDPAEHAAWSVLANTVLASDMTISLY